MGQLTNCYLATVCKVKEVVIYFINPILDSRWMDALL